LRRVLDKYQLDLLFVPSGAIAPGIKVQAIPWVHDLIIFEHPEWFNQGWLQRKMTTHFFAKGIRRAPVVLAVSEYTKSKIVELLKIDESKVLVTSEGGDALSSIKNRQQITQEKEKARAFCENELGLKRKFVLFVGTVEPRKNVAMLMRAWKAARQRSIQAPDLVVVGVDGWKFDDMLNEVKSLSAGEDQFFHRMYKVTDEEKRQLLLAASLVAVPSKDEGFGRVVLEALEAGSLVGVSNVPALREVVDKVGMIMDAHDEEAWAAAILASVRDNRANKLRMELGLEQAKKFSWDKTAKIVYKALTNEHT